MVESSVIVGVSVKISELNTVNVSFGLFFVGVVGKFEGAGSWSGVVFELFFLSVEVWWTDWWEFEFMLRLVGGFERPEVDDGPIMKVCSRSTGESSKIGDGFEELCDFSDFLASEFCRSSFIENSVF